MASFALPTFRQRQPTGFATHRITVGTVSGLFPSIVVAEGHQLVISTLEGNTHSIFIAQGTAAVNAGTELAPGSGMMIAIDNANRLACIAAVANQILFISAEVQ